MIESRFGRLIYDYQQQEIDSGWVVQWWENGILCEEPLSCINPALEDKAREEASDLLGLGLDRIVVFKTFRDLQGSKKMPRIQNEPSCIRKLNLRCDD